MDGLSELTPKKIHEWKGVQFEITSPLPNYRLLTAIDVKDEPSYQEAISPIDTLNRFAISSINSMNLRQFETVPPKFNVAIVPKSQFIQATGIPENFRDWATVCARNLFGGDDRVDTVVTSSAHALKVDFNPDQIGEIAERERERERVN